MSENHKPRCQYGTPIKNQLIGAIIATGKIAQSARQVGMPVTSAQYIWSNFKKKRTTANHHRSGRPPILTDRDKRHIEQVARKSRRKPFREIGNELDPPVSETTIRNVLRARGYHRRIARRVPYLTKMQKIHRIVWARLYAKWKEADWAKVIWSDEAYIQLSDKRGRIFVTRRADEVFLDECLVPTFTQSPIRVMVWACIMEGRKGPLVVLEYPGGRGGGMNTARYMAQVLEGALKDFYHEMKQEKGQVVFQQDGAPCHRSKRTQNWFTKNKIPILYHPANSPDLNPIEPVWHELKKCLRGLPHLPSTLEQLIASVHMVWEEIPIRDVDKHVTCMSDRVTAIFVAKGGHTRF